MVRLFRLRELFDQLDGVGVILALRPLGFVGNLVDEGLSAEGGDGGDLRLCHDSLRGDERFVGAILHLAGCDHLRVAVHCGEVVDADGDAGQIHRAACEFQNDAGRAVAELQFGRSAERHLLVADSDIVAVRIVFIGTLIFLHHDGRDRRVGDSVVVAVGVGPPCADLRGRHVGGPAEGICRGESGGQEVFCGRYVIDLCFAVHQHGDFRDVLPVVVDGGAAGGSCGTCRPLQARGEEGHGLVVGIFNAVAVALGAVILGAITVVVIMTVIVIVSVTVTVTVVATMIAVSVAA